MAGKNYMLTRPKSLDSATSHQDGSKMNLPSKTSHNLGAVRWKALLCVPTNYTFQWWQDKLIWVTGQAHVEEGKSLKYLGLYGASFSLFFQERIRKVFWDNTFLHQQWSTFTCLKFTSQIQNTNEYHSGTYCGTCGVAAWNPPSHWAFYLQKNGVRFF